MHIHIKHSRGKGCGFIRKPLSIDVDPSFTIKQVKNIISPQMDAPPSDQFLSFGGRTLEDEDTLASHDGIQDGCTISVVILPNARLGSYHIFTSIRDGEMERQNIDLYIFYYYTVAQVKQAIYEYTGIPSSTQRLIFAGK